MFAPILDTFENEDIKQFAKKCLDAAPDYWFTVGASSTGKYHPQYALGDGGLARHTAALVRILNHMFSVESVANKFSSRQRDLLRVAGIAHDMMKSGTQKEYERSKWTRFDHPLAAAKMVEAIDGLPKEEILYIADAIRSHMGQWNTDKRNPGAVLPKPETNSQIILHLADYMASRKDIEVLFDGLPEAAGITGEPQDVVKPKKRSPEDVDVYEFQMRFGKYQGLTWPEIEKENPGYFNWAKDKDGFAFDVLRKYLKEKK